MIRSAVMNDYEAAESIMEQVQRLHAGWRPDVYRAGVTVLTPDYFDELVRGGQVLVWEEEGAVTGLVIFAERQAANSSGTAQLSSTRTSGGSFALRASAIRPGGI